MFAFLLFSYIGLPPFFGFLSKFFLLGAAVLSNQLISAILLLVLSGLSSYYYLYIVVIMFFSNSSYIESRVVFSPALVIFFALSFINLFAFVYFQPFFFLILTLL